MGGGGGIMRLYGALAIIKNKLLGSVYLFLKVKKYKSKNEF